MKEPWVPMVSNKISCYCAVFCAELPDSWEWLVCWFCIRHPHDLIQWKKETGLITTPRSFAMLMVPSSVSWKARLLFLGGGRDVVSYELPGDFFCKMCCGYMRKNSVFDVVVSNRIESSKYVQKMQWDQHYRFVFGELFTEVFCV